MNALEQLPSSLQLVSTMIRIAAEDPSARIGAWSPRDVAAHMALSERECFEPRIRAIAEGGHPTFDFYANDESDFATMELETALGDWAQTRSRLLDFVRGLSDDERARVGVHETYGEVSVDRYLEIALEHDRDHLSALERAAGELTR